MIKTIVASVLVFFLWMSCWTQSRNETEADKLLLKLPVRVVTQDPKNEELIENLEPGNFQLLINGRPIRTRDVFARTRSLAAGKTVRYFVLGIHGSRYVGQLGLGVSHFIRNVLKPTDQLVIWTPLKLYKMDISTARDKDQILGHIEKIAQNDIAAFNRARDEQAKILIDWLKTTEKKLKKGGQATISPVMFFLKHYDYEWNRYRERFILSNLAQFTVIASLAAEGQGEKYVIHFREKNVIPYRNQFLEIKNKIAAYGETLPKSNKDTVAFFSKNLQKIERAIDLLDNPVPVGNILNGFLGINLSYNLIYYESTDGKSAETATRSGSPRLEKLLANISRQTGGKIINEMKTENAVNTLAKIVDRYYQLVFPFDGVLEDKRIAVQLTLPEPAPAVDIYHKLLFKKEELKWLQEWVGGRDIGIFDYTLEQRRLSFGISGFKKTMLKDRTEPTGIVDVRIMLIDDKRNTVYESGNTLKAVKDSVNVSINLPAKHKGYFKLSIKVKDLVSKKETELNKYVKIK